MSELPELLHRLSKNQSAVSKQLKSVPVKGVSCCETNFKISKFKSLKFWLTPYSKKVWGFNPDYLVQPISKF